MDICISSYCFHNAFENGLLKALEFPGFCQKEYGVGKIEFYDHDFLFGPEGVLNLMDLSPGHPYLGKVKQACAEAKATIVAISAQNDFTTPGKGEWESHVKRVEQWIRIAPALDVEIIRINSGSWFCHPRDDGTDRLVEGLRRVGPLARDQGITLAIENHPLDLTSQAQAERLVEITRELNEFPVATCPDNGHIKLGQDVWPACLKTLLPAAKHCHVKFYAFTENGQESMLNYHRFFEIAREYYEGTLSIEFIPAAAVDVLAWWVLGKAALKRLRKTRAIPADVLTKVGTIEDQVFESHDGLMEALANRLTNDCTF